MQLGKSDHDCTTPGLALTNFVNCTVCLERALHRAAEISGVIAREKPIVSIYRRSIGSVVESESGVLHWLKVSGFTGSPSDPMRTGELTADTISGISKPDIDHVLSWHDQHIHWQALRMTLVKCGVFCSAPWISAEAVPPSEEWLEQLKSQLHKVARLETARPCAHMRNMAEITCEIFGTSAWTEPDEWSTAHGDLHWANITFPDLYLLDWEHWGRAPRGLDAATLMVDSIGNAPILRMIETAFESDLHSRSGKIARLFRCADRTLAHRGNPSKRDIVAELWAEGQRLLGSISSQ